MTQTMWEIYKEKQENHLAANHPQDGDNTDYSCSKCYPYDETQETEETMKALMWIKDQVPINSHTGATISLLKLARKSNKQQEVGVQLREVVYSLNYAERIPLEGFYKRLCKEFIETKGFQEEEEDYEYGAGATNLDGDKKEAIKGLVRKPIKPRSPTPDRHETLNIVDRSEKGYSSKKTSVISNEDEEDEEEEEDFKDIMKQFFKEFTKTMAGAKAPKVESRTRETRLVDFPTFKGEQQDPIAWLEAFEGACVANGVDEDRMIKIVKSYLRGEAHTWLISETIRYWNRPDRRYSSFVPLFTEEYCSIYRRTQWDQELRNLRQGKNETVAQYTAKLRELWRRVDPLKRKAEADKIMDFVRGLQPEYIDAVQGSMPTTINQAVEKAKAMEIARNIRMEMSGQRSKSYIQPDRKRNNERGFTNQEETIEETIRRVIQQEISGKGTSSKPCSKCGKAGHWIKECPEIECFNCHKKGHFKKGCKEKKQIQCFNCQEVGHKSPDCPKKDKRTKMDKEGKNTSDRTNPIQEEEVDGPSNVFTHVEGSPTQNDEVVRKVMEYFQKVTEDLKRVTAPLGGVSAESKNPPKYILNILYHNPAIIW